MSNRKPAKTRYIGAWGFNDLPLADIHADGFSFSQAAYLRVMEDRRNYAASQNLPPPHRHSMSSVDQINNETFSENNSFVPEPAFATGHSVPQMQGRFVPDRQITPIPAPGTSKALKAVKTPTPVLGPLKATKPPRFAKVPVKRASYNAANPALAETNPPTFAPTRLSFSPTQDLIKQWVSSVWLLTLVVLAASILYVARNEHIVVFSQVKAINNRVDELTLQLMNKSTAQDDVSSATVTVSTPTETTATNEQLQKMSDLIHKELNKPVNRAFRVLGTSRLMGEENDFLSMLKVIVPESTKSRVIPDVDLFMKRELKSEDLPLSDCLFLINEEHPYVDIELSQRLTPTRFEYTHISHTHLRTDEMKIAKPIRFAVLAKKFRDDYFTNLGQWDMLGEESTLSVSLIDQNPEDFDFDVVRVVAFANAKSKYVSIYRIKILSDRLATERKTDITTP